MLSPFALLYCSQDSLIQQGSLEKSCGLPLPFDRLAGVDVALRNWPASKEGAAPLERQKRSVSKDIRVVGGPCAYPTYLCQLA